MGIFIMGKYDYKRGMVRFHVQPFDITATARPAKTKTRVWHSAIYWSIKVLL